MILKEFDPFGNIEREKLAGQLDERWYEHWHAVTAKLPRVKNRDADDRRYYRKRLELSMIGALVLFIMLFHLAGRLSFTVTPPESKEIIIAVEDIPVTQQAHKPPPPQRPTIPVPTDSEHIPEDLTIESTELNLTDIPAPPPPPEDDMEEQIFIAYDEPPEIIGGQAALLAKLKFPEIARRTGLDCLVVAKVLVGSDGQPRKVEILKVTQPEMQFEEAAIKALKQIEWRPAKQRDRAIATWVAIPVHFRLSN
jgi:protein TonB